MAKKDKDEVQERPDREPTDWVADRTLEKAVAETNKPSIKGQHVMVSIFPKLDLVIEGGKGEWVKGPANYIRRAVSNRKNVKFHNHVAKVDKETLDSFREKRPDGIYVKRRYEIEYIGLEDWKALYKNKETRKRARDFVEQVERRQFMHLAGKIPAGDIKPTITAMIDEIFHADEDDK